MRNAQELQVPKNFLYAMTDDGRPYRFYLSVDGPTGAAVYSPPPFDDGRFPSQPHSLTSPQTNIGKHLLF